MMESHNAYIRSGRTPSLIKEPAKKPEYQIQFLENCTCAVLPRFKIYFTDAPAFFEDQI